MHKDHNFIDTKDLKTTVKKAFGEMAFDLKMKAAMAKNKNFGHVIDFKNDLDEKQKETKKALVLAQKAEGERLLGGGRKIVGVAKNAFIKLKGTFAQEINTKFEQSKDNIRHLIRNIKPSKN